MSPNAVKIYKDGDSWCALLGENLQSGFTGFGDSPIDALIDFRENAPDELPQEIQKYLRLVDRRYFRRLSYFQRTVSASLLSVFSFFVLAFNGERRMAIEKTS